MVGHLGALRVAFAFFFLVLSLGPDEKKKEKLRSRYISDINIDRLQKNTPIRLIDFVQLCA